jgi:MFS family permease
LGFDGKSTARLNLLRNGRGRAARLFPDFRGLPRAFWVLFAGTLVNRVCGFVLTFLAIYLTDERGLSAAQAGAVMSAYGLGAIGGGPVGGVVSDRIGRRPALILSLVGGGASMLTLGFVTRMASIVGAAALTGFLYEMYRPIVSATIADAVNPDDRPRAYNLNYWAVNIGASIAPLIGGYLAVRSYRVLFAADAATAALYGAIVWAALPETAAVEGSHQERRGSFASVFSDGVFLILCALTLVAFIVFFQSFTGLPMDLRARGVSPRLFGVLIAFNGVLIVLLQPIAGELVRDRSRPLTLAVASMLIGVGFGMNAFVTSVAGYVASVTMWTLGEILFAPGSVAFVADLAPDHMRGTYQGIFAFAFTAAFAAAPVVGGSIIAAAGARTLWISCLATSVAVAVGFVILARFISARS